MLPIHWVCIFLSMKKMWKLCFSEKAVKVFYIQPIDKAHKREIYPTSLVFLCLRICLSMEGTWSQCRSQEAPTFCRATQQESRTAEAPSPRTGALQQENPSQWEASALWWRAATLSPTPPATNNQIAQEQWRPLTAINQPITCKKQPDHQTSRRGHYRPLS